MRSEARRRPGSGDGIGRAFRVAQAAWQGERNRKAGMRRHRAETEFLPAALEVLETPASPTARYTFWALVVLLVMAIGWSFIGKLDVVAVASGRTIPNGKTKVVQPLEAGVVRAIHVRDGQTVGAGDVLVELDPTAAGADMRRVTAELVAARAEVARLTAAADPGQRFHAPIGTPAGITTLQLALLRSQRGEQQSKLETLDAEYRKRLAELKSAEAEIRKLEKALPLLRKRRDARQLLADEGYGSKLIALELQQQLVEMEYELASLRHKREEAAAALDGIRRQREQTQSQYLKDVLSQRSDKEQKVATLEEDLLKAEQKRGLQTLTAPIDGVVQQLAIHTLGGVVTPAQVLMVIVPTEARLEVEAMVKNQDIGFIRPGQKVAIKLEAFQFTKYGTIPGEVSSISRDAVADKQAGLIYPIRISLDRDWIDAEGTRMPLGAGMALTAEIKTDRRRLIDYFLSPIARYRDESLRER